MNSYLISHLTSLYQRHSHWRAGGQGGYGPAFSIPTPKVDHVGHGKSRHENSSWKVMLDLLRGPILNSGLFENVLIVDHLKEERTIFSMLHYRRNSRLTDN